MNEPGTAAPDVLAADVRAALGEERVDLVLKNCHVINVYSQEIHRADIAIRGSTIVAVRKDFPGHSRKTIDCERYHAAPGMVQLEQILKASAPGATLDRTLATGGVTTWITQGDEKGVASSSGGRCGRTYFQERSLPPSSKGEVQAPLARDRSTIHPVNYRLCSTVEEAVDAIRLGVRIFLMDPEEDDRAADIWNQIQRSGMETSRLCLCWSNRGDGNNSIRAARAGGVALAEVFRMLSLNPAAHFSLDHKIGSISPGRKADIILLEGVDRFPPARVVFDGQIVGEEGGACR